jgi:hypothetical protein
MLGECERVECECFKCISGCGVMLGCCGGCVLWRLCVVEVVCCGGCVLWRLCVVEVVCCGGCVLWGVCCGVVLICRSVCCCVAVWCPSLPEYWSAGNVRTQGGILGNGGECGECRRSVECERLCCLGEQ